MSKPTSTARLLRRFFLRRRAALRAARAQTGHDAPTARPFLPAPTPVLLLPATCDSSPVRASRANAIRPYASAYTDTARSKWEAGKVRVAREGAALWAEARAGRWTRPAHLCRYVSPWHMPDQDWPALPYVS